MEEAGAAAGTKKSFLRQAAFYCSKNIRYSGEVSRKGNAKVREDKKVDDDDMGCLRDDEFGPIPGSAATSRTPDLRKPYRFEPLIFSTVPSQPAFFIMLNAQEGLVS